MGTWGVDLFSDDTASELRDNFRDLIADGMSSTSAVDKLKLEYKPDEYTQTVFWLALAAAEWEIGRLDERTKKHALTIINSGQDLNRWDNPNLRKKRGNVLSKLKDQLISSQPAVKNIRKKKIIVSDWNVGEIFGVQLASGNWVLFRVIGHSTYKSGEYVVCELLDWVGKLLPQAAEIAYLPVRNNATVGKPKQFVFMYPGVNKQLNRIKRTGFICTPQQKPDGHNIFLWNYINTPFFKDDFGLE